MISPLMWIDTPFRDRTALLDFQGSHYLWHVAVAETAARNGFAYQTYPLGDGVGSPMWQRYHQLEHAAANLALGISGPVNLMDYDFNKAEDWASFHLVHSQESQRLRIAAGIS